MPTNGDFSGSPTAGLLALYAAHRTELLRFLVARTGSSGDAEDLMQELWLRVTEAPTGPIANGRAYLYRMAQNLALDRLREARRRERRERDWADVVLDQRNDAPEPKVRADAEAVLIGREDVGRLAAAIAALPSGAARAFRLHKLDGLSQADTAVRLGISRSGVEKHIAVAMAHLRRALAEDELG